VPSPNCDRRPSGADLDLVVIHGISLPPGCFGGSCIDELFANELVAERHPYFRAIASLRVSSHVLIDRGGSLTQYVSFLDRAWHAGESSYCGRTACNDFSVGIELEGTDETPYEPIQYGTLAGLIQALRQTFPSLREADVVGHCDIAPERKTDPGPAFDWPRLRRLLRTGA
jgi:AmpD protein